VVGRTVAHGLQPSAGPAALQPDQTTLAGAVRGHRVVGTRGGAAHAAHRWCTRQRGLHHHDEILTPTAGQR
jgi:hypothetical protein